MPRVWITRSASMAQASAARLKAKGYDAFAAPLIHISYETPDPDAPCDEAYLIFTSRNGVAAFAQAQAARHWPCLCVGDATAKAARDAGFEIVTSARGAADDIVAWARKNIDHNQPLYHAAGNHPRGEIIERLQQGGFKRARRELFYRSLCVTHDPRLEPKQDDIILLYSPMAAQGLAALGLDISGMVIISLSRAVDAALGAQICKERYIADLPTEDSLFAHLP